MKHSMLHTLAAGTADSAVFIKRLKAVKVKLLHVTGGGAGEGGAYICESKIK